MARVEAVEVHPPAGELPLWGWGPIALSHLLFSLPHSQSREQGPTPAWPGPRTRQDRCLQWSRSEARIRASRLRPQGHPRFLGARPGDCACWLCLATALTAGSPKKPGPGEQGGDSTLIPRAAGPINPCRPGRRRHWRLLGGATPAVPGAVPGPSLACLALPRPHGAGLSIF